MVPESVMELLAKLKNVTVENGSAPAEAERAASYLSRLLNVHQLSIADVEERSLGEPTPRYNAKRHQILFDACLREIAAKSGPAWESLWESLSKVLESSNHKLKETT